MDYHWLENQIPSAANDYYFAGNVKTQFHSQIRKNRVTWFRAKGERAGGTFSGHPTCTTFGNTYRNWQYHVFAVWYNQIMCPFYAQIQALPTSPFFSNKVMYPMPNFKQFI